MRVSFGLALTSLAISSSALAAEPETFKPGDGIDVSSYRVELTPNFESKTLSGHARVLLQTTQPLSSITFSKSGLTIGDAQINGRPAQVRRDGGKIILLPARPLKKGQRATVVASFSGKPARGVTFTDQSVFTSYWACDWMICSQDTPGDKATFELKLILPVGYKSMSVGSLRSVKADRSGKSVHTWAEKRPYSSYLYAFAAGPFETQERQLSGGRLLNINATGESIELERLFGTTPAMVAFLQDKAGLPLPAGGYSQLLVSGSEAQEAATFSIIGLKQVEPILKDPENDWVLIHELAHQWWGNLITCSNWNHFWLNEGMAVFMTAAWKEHRHGRAAYERELDVARVRLAKARAAGFDKPLTFSGEYPSLAVRRAVQYSKGALFLDHLRTQLGDAAFWAGLRRYTRDHAGGVVDSRDFQRAMEMESRKNLSATFNEWVYEAK